jgi:hypothetical protein
LSGFPDLSSCEVGSGCCVASGSAAAGAGDGAGDGEGGGEASGWDEGVAGVSAGADASLAGGVSISSPKAPGEATGFESSGGAGFVGVPARRDDADAVAAAAIASTRLPVFAAGATLADGGVSARCASVFAAGVRDDVANAPAVTAITAAPTLSAAAPPPLSSA